MSQDLHNLDEIFKLAYQRSEETPSIDVWDKINANINKNDAVKYKRRFIAWKRTAFILILLMTGSILYESGIFKFQAVRTGDGNIGKKLNLLYKEKPLAPGSNNTVLNNSKNASSNPKEINEHHDKKGNANHSVSSYDEFFSQEKNQISETPLHELNNTQEIRSKLSPNRLEGRGNISSSRVKIISGTEEVNIKNKSNHFQVNKNQLMNKFGFLLLPQEKNSFEKIVVTFVDGLRQLQSPFTKDFWNNSNAKTNKGETIKYSKPFWTITAFISYQRVGYRLDSDWPMNITNIKHREVHEPSSYSGLLFDRQLKKQWSLQTGFTYSNTQIGISPQKMYALQGTSGNVAYKYVTSSGYAYIKPAFGAPPVVGDSLTTTDAKHTLQYISVPGIIKYQIGKKKFSVIPGVGLEANVLASAKLETELRDASNLEIISINKLKGTKSFNWSFIAEAEFQYQVNKRIAVHLRPVFRDAISPITKNNLVQTFPYSFGLGFGVKYRL